MQTKKQSVIETVIGTAIGFVLAIVVGQWVIYPLCGLHPTLFANVHLTVWFTVLGMARSYLTRRWFNRLNR